MAEVVVTLFDARDRNDAAGAAELQRDVAGGIGRQGQLDHVAHQPLAADEVVGVADVDRFHHVDVRLGLVDPGLGFDEPVLEVADAGEIGVEPLAVAASELPFEGFGVIGDEVHNALAFAGALGLLLPFAGRVIDEQPREDFGRRIDGRDHGSVFGVGRAVAA